jgi:hypothetical protein
MGCKVLECWGREWMGSDVSQGQKAGKVALRAGL